MKRFLTALDLTFKALGVDLRGLAKMVGVLAAGAALVAAMTIWEGFRAIMETAAIGVALVIIAAVGGVFSWMFVEEFKTHYNDIGK